MAQFRPSLQQLDQLLDPLTAGEQATANALVTLDDGWTVYVRPRIGLDVPSFVALHDLAGVCAIEVLDWRPGTYRMSGDGVIEQRDNLGAWRRSPEHPRFRASRYRTMIYDQFFALPSDGPDTTEAVRAAVVLPHFSNADAVELLSHSSVGERERKVAVWGGDGLVDQLDRIVRGAGCAHPHTESILRLRQHVVTSERVAHPEARVELGAGVRDIEQNPTGARFRRVRGPAGCGKSIGLTARAARLAGEGKRVLVLSFNVTLASHLSTLVTARCREQGANPTLVTCSNFHSFCARVVQDAELAGLELTAPRGKPWPMAIVAKTEQAYTSGFERRYDAILVDEGQDFSLDWWNLLRSHALGAGGEMLLTVDPAQDLYERQTWMDEAQALAAGFTEPWTELTGSHRMPSDLLPVASLFAHTHLADTHLADTRVADPHRSDPRREPAVAEPSAVAPDRPVGATGNSIRRWRNLDRVGDIGIEVGREVVRLLREHPTLRPRDVTFLCEYHHDGVAAVAEIEAAGHPVHHIFSRDPDAARRRRKYRFWPDANGVTGCTTHSFKGWETTALVMGIGVEARSKRMAYVAMTRVKANPAGGASYLSVLNADRNLVDLQSSFESWGPPVAALRVG